MWMAIGGGMLTLLIAAMGKQKRDTCKGYNINIKGQRTGDFFVESEMWPGCLKHAAKVI